MYWSGRLDHQVEEMMEESAFSFIDWICLCGYLMLIVLFGTWHYRNVKDVSDFAVAGRSMMWLD